MRSVASVRQLGAAAWSYWSSALASMTSGLEDARPWLRVTINDLNLDPGPKQEVFSEYVEVSSTETVLAILHRLFAAASTRHATGYHLTAAAHRTKLNMDMKIAARAHETVEIIVPFLMLW